MGGGGPPAPFVLLFKVGVGFLFFFAGRGKPLFFRFRGGVGGVFLIFFFSLGSSIPIFFHNVLNVMDVLVSNFLDVTFSLTNESIFSIMSSMPKIHCMISCILFMSTDHDHLPRFSISEFPQFVLLYCFSFLVQVLKSFLHLVCLVVCLSVCLSVCFS